MGPLDESYEDDFDFEPVPEMEEVYAELAASDQGDVEYIELEDVPEPEGTQVRREDVLVAYGEASADFRLPEPSDIERHQILDRDEIEKYEDTFDLVREGVPLTFDWDESRYAEAPVEVKDFIREQSSTPLVFASAPHVSQGISSPQDAPHVSQGVSAPQDAPYVDRSISSPQDAPYVDQEVSIPRDIEFPEVVDISVWLNQQSVRESSPLVSDVSFDGVEAPGSFELNQADREFAFAEGEVLAFDPHSSSNVDPDDAYAKGWEQLTDMPDAPVDANVRFPDAPEVVAVEDSSFARRSANLVEADQSRLTRDSYSFQRHIAPQTKDVQGRGVNLSIELGELRDELEIVRRMYDELDARFERLARVNRVM